MTALTKAQRSATAKKCWLQSEKLRNKLVNPERIKFYSSKTAEARINRVARKASGKKANRKSRK